MALTEQAHHLIRQHFQTQELRYAIDATCGNGHDTEFLARLASEHVWSFDIQARALAATQHRLELANLHNVTLIEGGHQHMHAHLQHKVDCVMFNLGYLPAGDKSITTLADTTVSALQQSLDLLTPRGLLTVLCYPGHTAGGEEYLAVKSWLTKLDNKWVVTPIAPSSPKPSAPILLLISRLQHQQVA